jgi:hypothetical protein
MKDLKRQSNGCFTAVQFTIALDAFWITAICPLGTIPIALKWCIYDEMLDFQKNSK